MFGAFRSGTTAFCHLLNEATNASVTVEREPKLCIEARQLYEGTLTDPKAVLTKAHQNAISKASSDNYIFVDKNPNYLIFLPYLVDAFDCKFIYIHRDGRDVVRSMMDWYGLLNKSIYTLREDGAEEDRVDIEKYPWDYSLFRPSTSNALYQKWPNLSRFQKCSWYWAKYNSLALDLIEDHRWKDRIFKINMSSTYSDDMKEVYRFIGLKGFERLKIEELLSSRVNSVKWRSDKDDVFPDWHKWGKERTDQFDEFAESVMFRIGYYL